VIVLVFGLGGLLLGTALALSLHRLVPDVPERGATGPGSRRFPARLWYLTPLGMAAAMVIAHFTEGVRHAALAAVFSAILLALVAADLEWRRLPKRLLYPALALAVAACGLWPGRSALDSLAGGLIGFAVMLALFVALPGFGFGDVKLAALLGLLAGASHVVLAFSVGVLAGGLVALLLLVLRRAGPRSTMAYGPYLALGAFVGMLAP
jgi:leader peptidase (prepilin peptidase)/N-methyltransferase